jgi:hypothetical protein
LRDDINSKEFPLLQQAENYRARASEKDYKLAGKALEQTVEDLQQRAPAAIAAVYKNSPITTESDIMLVRVEKSIHKEFIVDFNKNKWQISLELSYDPSIKDLIEIGDHLIKNIPEDHLIRRIGIRLSLIHPFMIEHVGIDNTKIEPVLRIVAALGLSEVIAKSSGAKTQGEIRRNFNELISRISSPTNP